MKLNTNNTMQHSSGCKSILTTAALCSLTAVVIAFQPTEARAQGMPVEARKNIHELFNNHDKVTRKLEITDKGYTATTTTDDPALAKVLQTHVKQMETRLEEGYFIRRWDPAFAEYGEHYDDIQFRAELIEHGIKVIAVGKTDEAVKVAQNHAKVINQFVENGWTAHDASHPAILAKAEGNSAKASPGFGRGRGQGAGQACPACGRGGGQGRGEANGCGGCAGEQEGGGKGCPRN